jgi:hypothetical protein
LGSIRTPQISGLILRHELLSPPPRNFQRGNLLYKLVSSTNLDTNNLQCTNIIVSFRKPYIIVSMYGYVECLLHPGGVAKFSTRRRTSLLCLISN